MTRLAIWYQTFWNWRGRKFHLLLLPFSCTSSWTMATVDWEAWPGLNECPSILMIFLTHFGIHQAQDLCSAESSDLKRIHCERVFMSWGPQFSVGVKLAFIRYKFNNVPVLVWIIQHSKRINSLNNNLTSSAEPFRLTMETTAQMGTWRRARAASTQPEPVKEAG